MKDRFTPEELDELLSSRSTEDVDLELKVAGTQMDGKDLRDYCAAFANGYGGYLILGVDNKRSILGTKAFRGTHSKLPKTLVNEMGINVGVVECMHPKGRVLVFYVDKHVAGKPIRSTGRFRFPVRVGESLAEMGDTQYQGILRETEKDYSAQIVPNLGMESLSDEAVNRLRELVSQKSGNADYLGQGSRQFLEDLRLLRDGAVTVAAVILLGEEETRDHALSAAAQIIFEWRQDPEKIEHDARAVWRGPFVLALNAIEREFEARNTRFPFREGFIEREIMAFEKKTVREITMNAVAHRDYSLSQHAVDIFASPEAICIESPGGLVGNVTPENILYERAWRNERLAETLEKAGLVERAGQGLNYVFKRTIEDGKGLPVIDTNSGTFRICVPAAVRDSGFIGYLQRVMDEKQISLSLEQIIELEKIRMTDAAPRPRFKDEFLQLGLIERVGRTRGAKYMLARRYYESAGRPGLHTRVRGLSREQMKTLVLNHIKKYGKGQKGEFADVLPGANEQMISNLLQEMKRDGKIKFIGSKITGHWEINNTE